jgi:hypothetical protein
MHISKLDEQKKNNQRKISLRHNVLEKNHKNSAVEELRVMLESIGINGADSNQSDRGGSCMFHQFKPEDDGVNKVLGNVLPDKKPQREPRKNLTPPPLQENGMFVQAHREILARQQMEALEAPIIKAGKPPTTGSHGY